jgi:hypothetical protein
MTAFPVEAIPVEAIFGVLLLLVIVILDRWESRP